MKNIIIKAIGCVAFGTFSLCQYDPLFAQQKDTDSLKYPLQDRRGDKFTYRNNNAFNIGDTSLLKQTIEYDAKTKRYYIVEKIGNRIYRKQTYLTFKEFYDLQKRQQEADYFKLRSDALWSLNKKVPRPNPIVYPKFFDRTFGLGNVAPGAAGAIDNAKKTVDNAKKTVDDAKTKASGAAAAAKNPLGSLIDIKPTGNIDILMGYQGQYTNNPTIPERARRTGGFDFDMNANVGVNANIGDKLKLPINYNTLANFDYLNQIKLDYKGGQDEILKSIEAGNIGFEAKGTLIPSATNLFGLKTQLQFGKLFFTAALANQRSQRQSQTLQGGAAVQTFQKKLSDYDENRHFLVAQHFRKNYNEAMSKLPTVVSQIQVQRIEVWVTNRNGATTDARDIIAFSDLAEGQKAYLGNPSNTSAGIAMYNGQSAPNNTNNGLYNILASNPDNRVPSKVNTNMRALNLDPVNDYEKTFARKLTANEYIFNAQLGTLSLNSQLLPDEVLAVAYEYSLNGRVYKVGEFSQEVALDTAARQAGVQKMLFLKLLKATSARVKLPIWRLMMKNVYSLDLVGISKEDFRLNILYDQPSGGLNRYLPESSTAVEGRPLIKIIGLDNLNNRNDPQPDGQFDFVENFTILPQYGRIILPKLEPFGADLDTLAFANMPTAIRSKYVFRQLYDTIKAIAQTYANLDRFVMQGQAKGTSGSEIYLGAFNIPQGSVRINAGGQLLTEGSDYTIDYNLGSVKILNQAILNSGVPVSVSYENNATFGIQQKGFLGLRLDYKANKKLSFGATMERLNERPFFTKQNIGEDPVRNTIYGVDFSYKSNLPKLTKLLDKLPFYSTKTMSTITAYGEAAYFKPGHPPQIGSGANGLIYIDDFEGTKSSLDLRFPLVAWSLASTPQKALDDFGNEKYPESNYNDSLPYNDHRAKIAWYNIEPNLQDKNSSSNPLKSNLTELSDPRVRQIYTNELFPQQTTNITNTQTQTFDLSYYPKELGPYNFTIDPNRIDAKGRFNQDSATRNWGGLMRAIDQTDFETNNFEFIEFWVQNPYIKNKGNGNSGDLIINLGNVSEDILKDGKRFYENGMNTPNSPTLVDSSNVWGKTPVNPIQTTAAFSNNPADRPYQDVGFDGIDDEAEKRKRAAYIAKVANDFGSSSEFAQRAGKDPSNDNYVWFRDAKFDAKGAGLLERYKNYNNPQGNSPIADAGSQFSPATTLYPDNEDLNRDNTLNETEQYFEYKIHLSEGMDVNNTKYITDKRTVNVKYADGHTGTEDWFLFRVPLKSPERVVGNIPDFKSIRFARMYMTGFHDSINLRFARFDLVRNQWRQFSYDVDTTGKYASVTSSSTLSTLAVNLEENSARTPVNYVIPPGIERVQQLSNNGVNLLQNEQSLAIRVQGLEAKKSRAVFKTLNMDIRQYGKINMFAHVDYPTKSLTRVENGDLNLVIRIGQDYLSNYYEIKYPLNVTPEGKYTKAQANIVWPDSNNLDIDLQELISMKLRRNANSTTSVLNIYREQFGLKTISVFGNPNLGEVRGILVAVEHAGKKSSSIDAEVWINELRLSNINEEGAYAALGRVDVTLADLGKISLSANMHTQGFGSIESKIQERSRENLTQLDAAINIDAGKLIPKKAKLSIPVYASISKTIRSPQYDPYDKDVLYKQKLSAAQTQAQKDSIKNISLDQTTIKTINVTNMKVAAPVKPQLWSLSNFDVSLSYTQTVNTSPTIAENKVDKYRGAIGYSYQKSAKYIEPFKKLIKSKSKWFGLIKDFNFNPTPSTIGVRADINRQFGRFIPRIVNTDLTGANKVERVDTTYDKYFTFDRFYTVRWDISRSLNLDFNATNNARVDEPAGTLDTKAKKDSVKDNFFKGGRSTLYNQSANASYSLPLSKFPITDWMTARYAWKSNYNWIGASRVALELGNIIENGQDNTMTGQFDLSKLYRKSRLLRNLENPLPKGMSPTPINDLLKDLPKKEDVLNGLTGKKKDEALAKWKKQRKDAKASMKMQKQNQQMAIGDVPAAALKLLTMLKTVQVNYSENYKSRIPGWMDSTQSFGNNFKSMQPGLDYVFGKQPDAVWLDRKAAAGLFSRDSNFNLMFRQNYEQKLSFTAQLEPIKELLIDISLDKSFSKEYTELFKDTLNLNKSNGKQHLNPYAGGGFSVSFISFNTLFGTTNPNIVSETFKEFESFRPIISRRLAAANPYWAGTGTIGADGYASGYGQHSQDVLIPAFIAAYTKQDPNKVALISQNNNTVKTNPFKGILPKPNWRMTYTGLSKIPALAKTFSSINISHAYSGTLSMNSYTSALQFADPFRYGAPQFRLNDTGNYVPFFLVPNLTIQEQFQPLIGIDVTTTNQLNLKFEYKKSRILSLSLVDYQLSETKATEWTIGGSFRKKGARLPKFLMRLITKKEKLENDLSFKLDLSMRDEATSNSRLDQPNAYGTGGQKVITIQPAIDYVLNNRINIKFFFDQRKVVPYISTSAPTTSTRAGVQVRVSLQ